MGTAELKLHDFFQALEEQMSKLRSEEGVLRRDISELSANLQDEQRKVVVLTQELSTNTSSRQALMECEEKIRDLQKENSILRESNNKLLDSAYSVEVERQFHATENSLKVGAEYSSESFGRKPKWLLCRVATSSAVAFALLTQQLLAQFLVSQDLSSGTAESVTVDQIPSRTKY